MSADLVGPDEIAARLQIKPCTVAVWRSRARLKFPAPAYTVSRVPLWHWEIVRAWSSVNGRLPAARVEADSYSIANIAQAREMLPTIRAQVRGEVATQAGNAFDTLSNLGLLRILRAPKTGQRHGEWDWYWHLSPRERGRISRDFMPAASEKNVTACAPDQVADLLGYDTVDAGMAGWLRLTRIIDAGRAVGHHYIDTARASLFTTSYDLAAIFGPYAEAIAYVASTLDGADGESAHELRPLSSILGPSPLDLELEEWCTELEELRGRIDSTVFGDFPTETEQADLDRLAELLPARVLDATPIDASDADLYLATLTAYLETVA